MKRLFWPYLRRASFLQQLTVTFSLGLLVISALSAFGISTLSYQIVRDKWIAQGRQSTEAFAAQSILALLYASKENGEEPARRFLAFPDVQGVAVFNLARQALLERGESTVPSGTDASQWPETLQLVQETEQAWYFAAPVFARAGGTQSASPFEEEARPELIGHVRLALSKRSLNVMKKRIQWTTLGVSGGAAIVFFMFLVAMTRRLTSPIQQLAAKMGKASAGVKNVRANLEGPRDITDMGATFNTMMEVLETREMQLEKARDTALESARLKGEFAANVSHELRTPLNAVLGMLELLQDLGLPPKQLEYSMIARNAGEALLTLIEDILDFSKIEAGMLKRQPVDFVLSRTLDEVVELMSGQAHRKHLRLYHSIADDIPLVLNGDAYRIRQVLINLVSNALKFTEHGSISIGVALDAPDDDVYSLKFTVNDTGVGIPQDAQATIFDAFVQVDGSSTRHHQGAGLGLAICRQLVKLMGGQIGVESQPGQGSRFWFTALFEPPSGLMPLPDAKPASHNDLRALVVSESEITRQFLSQIFDHWQIRYSHADYGISSADLPCPTGSQDESCQFAILDVDGVTDLVDLEVMAEDLNLAGLKMILLSSGPEACEYSHLPSVFATLTKPIEISKLYELVLTIAQSSKPPLSVDTAAGNLPRTLLGGYILVVEDNRASQMVAAGMLDRLGCRYEVAATGIEALAWLDQASFDLILMDCHMPSMDGFEASRRIRSLSEPNSRIPIVAMTANAQIGDCALCFAAGMDDYLAKPVKLRPLREKLSFWLANYRVPNTIAKNEQISAHQHLLDEQVLAQLREELGHGYARMINAYLEDAPQQIEELGLAMLADDLVQVQEVAHSLKGASRNLGAETVAKTARQLEEAAERGKIVDGNSYLRLLRNDYQIVQQRLVQEIEDISVENIDVLPAGFRVLVADDDRGIRFALQDVLQKDGYIVDMACTGRQAVQTCRRQMADLILMDGVMPEMDGFEACRQIRELPKGDEVPILMITALENEHAVEQAFTVGANDYIPKPINLTVLRKRITHLLQARESQKTLNHLAYHDPLTHLANRAQFMERLNLVIGMPARQAELHAVLFLDLDRFKLTNDTMGHDIGDQLLKAAATRIQSCVRREDMVSRFGGDEFVLLLEKISDVEVAAAVADKICNAIAKPFALMGQEFYISSSIGISIFPPDGTDSGLLIKHADTAMYRAKEKGNTFCFYEDSMESAVSSKLRLERDLRRALQHGEFVLYYQPQIELNSRRIIAAEALIRWQHPEMGMITPDVFIPLAEEIGLIEAIGAWVLHEACRQNSTWQQCGHPAIVIAVNVSARQLEHENFAEQVIEVISETGLAPKYLELELTESLFIRNPEKKRIILARLRELGVQMSIDDFGTGYSSLNQLKRFAFDKLKIDKSFVANILKDEDAAAIVQAIISMARILKFKVIAEGVETDQQAQYLIQSGCDEVQGYLFGKPMPADAFFELLKQMERSMG